MAHGTATSFFVELKEAAKEYFQMNTNMACPVFQSIIRLFLRDRGWESRVGEEGIEEELWEGAKRSWTLERKGIKLGLPRWFSSIGATEDLDPEWH